MQRIRRKDREAGRHEVTQSRQATVEIMILKPRNKASFSQAPWVLVFFVPWPGTERGSSAVKTKEP